jgi:hypothetical protein
MAGEQPHSMKLQVQGRKWELVFFSFLFSVTSFAEVAFLARVALRLQAPLRPD